MSTRRLSTQWTDIGVDDIVRGILILLIAAVSTLPLLYGLSMSFRSIRELYGPAHFIPHTITLQFYVAVFADIGVNLLNSLLIATGVTILVLVVTIPGAYAFARFEFPGRRVMFYMIIFIMLLPLVGMIFPILTLWQRLGLYNTVIGLWLGIFPGTIPMALWILRDYFQKLPPNLEEAAMVYGTTRFRAFVQVVLPLATPAIIAVGFLAFLGGWNEFLFSNLLTTDQGPRPAIVVLFHSLSVDQANNWPYLMAMTFTIGIPPALMYILSRRYLETALNF